MHDLKGLSAASPIGFMAALGMLRVLTEDRKMDVRLGWRNGCAAIDGVDPETAISELVTNMHGRSTSPEFSWSDSPRKVSATYYRAVCESMKGDTRALGFMAGWATDAALSDGNVKATRMDMTSGKQQLLRHLRQLAAYISKEHIAIALLGGPYERQSSFGLDPATVQSHAHEYRAPTKFKKPPGKPGLIWLSFESIPFHQVVPVYSNRASTAGWRSGADEGYVWPIWDGFLTMEEAFLLRNLPVGRLKERHGVKEIWFSKYGSNGNYGYGILLPPQREL